MTLVLTPTLLNGNLRSFFIVSTLTACLRSGSLLWLANRKKVSEKLETGRGSLASSDMVLIPVGTMGTVSTDMRPPRYLEPSLIRGHYSDWHCRDYVLREENVDLSTIKCILKRFDLSTSSIIDYPTVTMKLPIIQNSTKILMPWLFNLDNFVKLWPTIVPKMKSEEWWGQFLISKQSQDVL